MTDEINTAPSETEQVAFLAEPTPGEIVKWRSEDKDRACYPNTTGFESIITNDHFEGANQPADKRTAAVVNLRNMLADTGMAPLEAQAMLNRASIVRAEGKTVEAARKEARIELSRMFPGDAKNPSKGVDQALADAGRLLRRDSRLANFIERQGLGNDAKTIATLARAAGSLRNQGKLK